MAGQRHMTPRIFLFAALVGLTVLRLFLAGQYDLFPDEAYYSMWAERMDWCFYSKGPGVATAIWIGTHLFGASEFGVRFLSPLFALGTSLIIYALGQRMFSKSVATWAVITFNVLPIFNVGAIIMTIDPISMFFWAAALLTLWFALEASPRFTGWWFASGLLIGLGFLAKYTNAMQLLSLVLLLAATKRYRSEFFRPGFWSMFLGFLPCLLPPLVWNSRNGWVTLGHLSARGGLNSEAAFKPGEFFEFFGSHLGVYSPLVFLGCLVAIRWALQKPEEQTKNRFLLAFAIPLLVMYSILSFKQAGEANWTAPAMISLGLLAVAQWHERVIGAKWARITCTVALALAAFMSVMILNTEVVRALGIRWSYEADPGRRMRGWRTAAAEVERFRADYEARFGEPVFLIANEHEVAASIGFYMKDKRIEGPGHPPVYIPASAAFEDQFSFWPRYDMLEEVDPAELAEYQKDRYGGAIFTEEQGINRFRGRTALYITDRPEENAPASIQDGFESWEMLACVDQIRNGLPLRQFRIFVCHNYLDPGVR